MIRFKDKIMMLFRSFFIQSCFNYERFQNIGFVFILAPVFRKIFKDEKILKSKLERYSQIFNTQPYMVGFIVGRVIKMEMEGRNEKEIEEVKQSLACAYASIGDRIFWSRLRVILAHFTFFLFSIIYFCCSSSLIVEALTVSVIVPTIFYMLYTLYIRYMGIKYGFECVDSKLCGLDKFPWNKIMRFLSRVAFFMSVVVFLIFLYFYGFFYIDDHKRSSLIIYISIPFISFFVQRYFRKNKKNIFYPIIFMILISLIIGCFV